jgi:hypothetical protein
MRALEQVEFVMKGGIIEKQRFTGTQ